VRGTNERRGLMSSAPANSLAGLRRVVRRGLAARRAHTAMATNAMSSLGNLALTVAVARSSDASTFGEFAVALSVYVLLTGLARAAVTDSILSLPNAGMLFTAGIQRLSFLGLGILPLTLPVAISLGSPFIFWLALSMHGMFLYDFVKIYNMSIQSPRIAIAQEAIWTLLTSAFVVLGLCDLISPSIVFLGWAATCALIGYANGYRHALTIKPIWPRDRKETRISIIYSLDFLAGSGSAQLPTYLIAGISGTAIVGVLRGGGTFYSPFTLIITTALALSIPYLTQRRIAGPNAELKAAKYLTGVQLLILAPPALVVAFLPMALYRAVLGATGSQVRPIMLPLAIELIFIVATTVAFAGHRAQRAGIRTLMVRGVMAPLRVVVVVVAAVQAGASGAAWAMASMAIVGAVLLWWSYSDVVKRGDLPDPLSS
jgi:O-antigen/teichoic acid export membrane protein